MTSPLSLRGKLTVLLVALLAAVTLILGLLTHALMERSLTRQTDEQLKLASERASHVRSGPGSHDDDAAGSPQASASPSARDSQGSSPRPSSSADPLDAPGQSSGTLSAVISTDGTAAAQILDPKTGERTPLTEGDAQALRAVQTGAAPQTVELTVGDYRVQAVSVQGQTRVTGLPMAPTKHALDSLFWIVFSVGTGGLVLAGLTGMLLIRRELRPLERVAQTARQAAQLPLDAGEVRLAPRVAPSDARSGTEAGAVGLALNDLLDKVENALEARQSSEMKLRQFVADASHELRNPLAAIRGYSDLLGATEHFSDDGHKALGRVQAQSRRMSLLVEDLLLLARLDEGRRPQMADVDLTRMVLETVNDFRVAAPEHRWSLDMPEEPILARGEERQIHQILSNLLSNARKHTAPGTLVTAGLRASTDRQWALLTVTDTGEGISPDFLPAIFQRFTRADAARSGSDGTTGLGLSIVEAIVRAHGGSVNVESAPGRTQFLVRLPLLGSV